VTLLFPVPNSNAYYFVVRGTFELCSYVPLNISVILIFILEETQELITTCTLGQSNGSHIFKEERPYVPEAVIQEAVRAVQERRLSLRFAASSYGLTHTAMHNRILKNQQL